ncbi:MAG: DUF1349 domain-containing protein [Anaerolineae bacterium]
MDLSRARWLNRPAQSGITGDTVTIITEPNTDFWQRSYYGFRHDNAPALLFIAAGNFTFTVKVSFRYQTLFDQCGVVAYLDSDNWVKASVEYESEAVSKLGSVVTNLGHSDWATTDTPTPGHIWYRLSRRGPDFLLESSPDGVAFTQMRILHLHGLGETSEAMGLASPPLPAAGPVEFGVYACSPLDSSFAATFSHFKLEDCRWQAHSAE